MLNQAFVRVPPRAVTGRGEPVGKMNFVEGRRVESVACCDGCEDWMCRDVGVGSREMGENEELRSEDENSTPLPAVPCNRIMVAL